MPSPNAPEEWQCTDVPALKNLPKNRSCLAYDSSNGYTYQDGKCVTSDYNGCIDTYNKFKNMKTCSLSMKSFASSLWSAWILNTTYLSTYALFEKQNDVVTFNNTFYIFLLLLFCIACLRDDLRRTDACSSSRDNLTSMGKAECSSSRTLKAPIRAYFYNSKMKQCNEFEFFGCSSNVFLDRNACVKGKDIFLLLIFLYYWYYFVSSECEENGIGGHISST